MSRIFENCDETIQEIMTQELKHDAQFNRLNVIIDQI